jgi:3-hydroxybutyryl-CoA dehydrogenase
VSETIAIIGAGPLGRWLALSAARAGFRVLLEDVMPANLHHARQFLREQLGAELSPRSSLLISGSENAGPSAAVPAATSAQDDSVFCAQDDSMVGVTLVSTIEDAVREADLAIDCVPDELESKLEILWLLDRMAPPRTVLATPTTRLSIADLASCTYREEKCVAIAAIAAEAKDLAGNPGAQILLRTTTKTSPETVALVRDFWQRLGFTPIFARDPAEQTAKNI